MKILVLSDSHAGLSFMRRCISKTRPDAVIHLGDFFDDGETIKEEYPHLNFYQVPGNCDRYRCPPWMKATLCYDVCGVRLYMTHGHKQNVKTNTALLVAEAHAMGAQAALYGHTHIPDCHREPDGLWVLNPGSCGGSGSAGIIEIEDQKICACYLIRQADLEAMV